VKLYLINKLNNQDSGLIVLKEFYLCNSLSAV